MCINISLDSIWISIWLLKVRAIAIILRFLIRENKIKSGKNQGIWLLKMCGHSVIKYFFSCFSSFILFSFQCMYVYCGFGGIEYASLMAAWYTGIAAHHRDCWSQLPRNYGTFTYSPSTKSLPRTMDINKSIYWWKYSPKIYVLWRQWLQRPWWSCWLYRWKIYSWFPWWRLLCEYLTLYHMEVEFGRWDYHKCPKISDTRVSDKMVYANNADPDWECSFKSSLIRVFFVYHSAKYFMKQLHKKAKFRPKKYGLKC